MTSANPRTVKIVNTLRDILSVEASEETYGYLHVLLLLRFLSVQLEDNPEDTPVDVPLEAQWSYLRRQADAVGSALDSALKTLVASNADIFPDFLAELTKPLLTDDGNDDVLSSHSLLTRAIATLSVNLTRDDITEIHNQLLAAYIEVDRKTIGQFSEPMQLSRLLAQLLEPSPDMTIHDPACGLGNTLLACVDFVRKTSEQDVGDIHISGQDINCRVAAHCFVNLYLNGVTTPTITCGDTLDKPVVERTAKKTLATFDMVVGDPPFGISLKNNPKDDPYNRFMVSTFHRRYADAAFLQHWISVINEGGRGAIVIPHGLLFRAAEREVRQSVIMVDVIEAVIGLPNNILGIAAIPIAIVVLNKAKATSRRDRVLFINASEDYERQRGQNLLRDEDIDKIVETYHTFTDEDGFARVVDLDTIAENDYQLSVNLYTVAFEDATFSADVPAKQQALETAERAFADAQKAMDDAVHALGFDSKGKK